MFQMSGFPLICIKDHKVLLKAASWELGQLHSPGRLKRKIFWVQDAGGASSGAGGASSRASDEPCNYFTFQPRSNLSLKEPPVSPGTAAAATAGAVRPRRLSRRAGLPHGDLLRAAGGRHGGPRRSACPQPSAPGCPLPHGGRQVWVTPFAIWKHLQTSSPKCQPGHGDLQ